MKSLLAALCVSSVYFLELWKRRVELAFRVAYNKVLYGSCSEMHQPKTPLGLIITLHLHHFVLLASPNMALNHMLCCNPSNSTVCASCTNVRNRKRYTCVRDSQVNISHIDTNATKCKHPSSSVIILYTLVRFLTSNH